MRFLVAGCGSIGNRHLRNLIALGVSTSEIGLYDTDPKMLAAAGDATGVSTRYLSLSDALSRDVYDAVLVCAPTVFHTEVARAAVRSGCHIFMEKPIARDAEALDELLAEASDRKRVFMVGYIFRFHPGYAMVRKMIDDGVIGRVYAARAECGMYLPDWHPHQDYRKFYMSKEAEGGGAVLDISHEFDYVKAFVGSRPSEVTAFVDTISPLEIDADDISATTVRFENRSIATVHLDLLQRIERRNCELIGEKGTIFWDQPSSTVSVFTPESGRWIDQRYECDFNSCYIDELRHFIECVHNGTKPVVDGTCGYETLKIVLAAKRSSREKRVVPIDR